MNKTSQKVYKTTTYTSASPKGQFKHYKSEQGLFKLKKDKRRNKVISKKSNNQDKLRSSSMQSEAQDFSTSISDEIYPNEEYYGSIQMVTSTRFVKRTEHPKKRKSNMTSKNHKEDNIVHQLMQKYRDLQLCHLNERMSLNDQLLPRQFHRLRKIQEVEMKMAMERLISYEEKILFK